MLMTFRERQSERLQRRIEELQSWRNAGEFTIDQWQLETIDGGEYFMQRGDFWPVVETPVHLHADSQIPFEWSGLPVELELAVGGEGFVQLSTGYQAGLNPLHHRFHVTDSAEGGKPISIDVEAVPKGLFGSHIPEPRLDHAQFVVPNSEARAYERDLVMLVAACQQLGDHEVVDFLYEAAEASLSELANGWPTDSATAISRYVLGYDDGVGSSHVVIPKDILPEAVDAQRPTKPIWHLPPSPKPLEPLPASAKASLIRARTLLADRLDQIREDYPPVGRLCLTGHAHIDLAWLWPVAETRRKTRRTFSTVINLMNQYDDFTFNQSSAQAYTWIAEDDPALFEQIKERVAEGRWEPIGGMWVESDANVPSGESFTRQLLYGQRYFEQTFGKRNHTVWLPDVFGYSANLPQLMRGAGIEHFYTIKLTWNEANRFPYDLFTWEGIDGSSVMANIILNPGHGYNGNIVPLDTLGTWRGYRQKTRHNETILSFGWGDGAGGPSERMLENYERIRDFPALPRLRMGSIEQYFASISSDDLPKWIGELYLELHRGTYTSQAKTKQLNRQAEHRLLEAEAFATLASLSNADYPADSLESSWKTLLLNQFHDILPGSSIAEVYEDSHREMTEVVERATQSRNDALHQLGGIDGDRSYLVANAGLNPQRLQVVLPGLDAETTVRDSDGRALPAQVIENGLVVGDGSQCVPGLGWQSISITGEARNASEASITNPVSISALTDGSHVLENDQIRIVIGDDGALTNVFDKVAERESLSAQGNQLWAYVDKPYDYDAWEIDEMYDRDGEEITDVESIAVIEAGPLRASVKVVRKWRDSTIAQTYRLSSNSRRIDILTEIDWHQRQMMVKARFPLAVRSHEATFETMFGAVNRPTHRNAPIDAAKFEVCGHRFGDISEPGYGVALLNDSKYGYDVNGNVLSLTLLTSPLYPDPFADEGRHEFTYSLLPHIGNWTESEVVTEAFGLNSPLIASPGKSVENVYSFVECSGLELALGSLKSAEDSTEIILRLYEPHGRRGPAQLRFALPVETAEIVNLLEEPLIDATTLTVVDHHQIELDFNPFEVKTVKLSMKRAKPSQAA